jgi:endonuclease III
VLRVANRIGIANSDDPAIVEQQLCAALPPPAWTRTSDTLILHGRRICKPRPLCEQCSVREDCEYYRKVLGVVRGRDQQTSGRMAARLKPKVQSPKPSRTR